MKRLFFAALFAVALLCACGDAGRGVATHISGRFVGSNVDTVYLERVSDTFAAPERIGAQPLADNGAFSFEFDVEKSLSPRFYKLTFSGNTRPVTLVVKAGDKIELESAGDIFINYRVSGSEESALICEFNHAYFGACDRLARIAENLSTGSRTMSEMELQAYRTAQEAIQTQLRFVGSNQGRLAAFYAVRHNVAEQYIPQLSGYGVNVVHYRTVLEGLVSNYPDSPYIAVAEREIADMEALVELGENVETISYPDLELEDIYKTKHRLSSLDGKVILLYFWSASNALCNNLNADLKPLYEHYSKRGFEVYHVSADADKAQWIEAVRQQGHPWISVYGGNNPEVFGLYNVTQLPASYLIDRRGNIEPCNYDIDGLEARLKRML